MGDFHIVVGFGDGCIILLEVKDRIHSEVGTYLVDTQWWSRLLSPFG